jgi:hypothetical protein
MMWKNREFEKDLREMIRRTAARTPRGTGASPAAQKRQAERRSDESQAELTQPAFCLKIRISQNRSRAGWKSYGRRAVSSDW